MVNLDYFYGSEGEQYRFYQIPAILLEDEEYKKIIQKVVNACFKHENLDK